MSVVLVTLFRVYAWGPGRHQAEGGSPSRCHRRLECRAAPGEQAGTLEQPGVAKPGVGPRGNQLHLVASESLSHVRLFCYVRTDARGW
jgi:hypothetical protein